MKRPLLMLGVLLLLTGAAFTGSSPLHKKAVLPKASPTVYRVVVGIGAGGIPTVDQDTVTLVAANGDSVIWVAGSGVAAFSIQFPAGSPFNQSSFASAGGSMASGAIRAGANGNYKYSVGVNGRWLDPTVIVKGGHG